MRVLAQRVRFRVRVRPKVEGRAIRLGINKPRLKGRRMEKTLVCFSFTPGLHPLFLRISGTHDLRH